MIEPQGSDAERETDLSRLEKGPIEVSAGSTDIMLVSWEGPDDPSNPYNWSLVKKWCATVLVSLGGLITLMSGAMLAPALSAIGNDLSVSQAEASLMLSIYVLAFAFGPMVLAPCSEVWGRRPIWLFGSIWYVIWNTVCGFSKNAALMIVGRIMAGLGASAEFAVSGAIVADCWTPDSRGKSMAIRSFLPLLGPALGPIVGGAAVETLNWSWLFWLMSIFAGVVVILFIFSLPETHTPTILSRKAAALRKSTGLKYYTKDDLEGLPLTQRLKAGLLRPTTMLLTQPVIQIIAFVQGYQFGLVYILLSTYSSLWTDRYGQSSSVSSLHYLTLVIGYTIASQCSGWALDKTWAKLKEKNQGETKPEYRVPMMIPGAILIPIGLLWYGFSAQQRLHWIMPDIGAAIFGCGYISAGYAAQAYVVDAFLEFNASAGAASQLLRNIFAFAFPLFGPSLYDRLGYGLGNTVLASISAVLALPAPLVLWRYGEQLRQKRVNSV
ncbi:major facilitator superfamily transporter [Lophiostoma macrostomum CBS 122681]|uniref:Major facilitator superfamily transporter n=1 Tax=Lophiostoma macrostomum CBS 122681 TaxID=1314788 RepID=A0A6A6SZ91_9PLEO|nr:major facilitator superfamily transporter [Lophiostoma macrostomum CBS 122681]